MPKPIDLTGRRFGRLTVLRKEGPGACWQQQWRCLCDCGREVVVFRSNLASGHTRSCGCLRSERMRELHNPQEI